MEWKCTTEGGRERVVMGWRRGGRKERRKIVAGESPDNEVNKVNEIEKSKGKK